MNCMTWRKVFKSMKRNEYKLPFLLPKAVCFSNYLHDYSNSKWKIGRIQIMDDSPYDSINTFIIICNNNAL